MRGTASNDIVLEDVFVPDERVLANRPYGVIDPPLQVIVSIAMPIISGVYLGVAEAAYEAAVDAAAHARPTTRSCSARSGSCATASRSRRGRSTARSTQVGRRPRRRRWSASPPAMAAKREIALAGIEVCDLAMEVGRRPGLLQGLGRSSAATATSGPPSSTR